jgi:hypothetical protein
MRHHYCDLFDAVDGALAHRYFSGAFRAKSTAFSACVAV